MGLHGGCKTFVIGSDKALVPILHEEDRIVYTKAGASSTAKLVTAPTPASFLAISASEEEKNALHDHKSSDVVIPSSPNETVPLVLSVDVMTYITKLRGTTPIELSPAAAAHERERLAECDEKTQAGASNTVQSTLTKQSPGAPSPKEAPPSYRADDLADTMLEHFERFADAHRANFPGLITICLVFDKAGAMPVEKLSLQKERVEKSRTQPYSIDLRRDQVVIQDAGLCVNEEDPIPIDMGRLCLTRAIRPYFYKYLVERAKLRRWKVPLRLIVDAEFPGTATPHEGHKRRRVADEASGVSDTEQNTPHRLPHFNKGAVWTFCAHKTNALAQVITRTDPKFMVGEGEIGAILWALHHAATHHCQVWSGDSDILPLLLVHGHRFAFSLTALLCEHYTFRFREAESLLKQQNLSALELLAAVCTIGTDYTTKKIAVPRVPNQCIWAATRRWSKTPARIKEQLAPPPRPHKPRSAFALLTPQKSTDTDPKNRKAPQLSGDIHPWDTVDAYYLFLRDIFTVYEIRRCDGKRTTFDSIDITTERLSPSRLWASAAKRAIRLPAFEVATKAFRAFSFVAKYWLSLQNHAPPADFAQARFDVIVAQASTTPPTDTDDAQAQHTWDKQNAYSTSFKLFLHKRLNPG